MTQAPFWCAVSITRVAWLSLSRNTALSTCTTNSRGVKSSLSRITFHSGGRWVLGLVLVRGLTRVGLIGHPGLDLPVGRSLGAAAVLWNPQRTIRHRGANMAKKRKVAAKRASKKPTKTAAKK